MKAQIIEQLKQTQDKKRIDQLLDELSITIYLERFENMDALLIHLGSKPLLEGVGTGEIINLARSALATAATN